MAGGAGVDDASDEDAYVFHASSGASLGWPSPPSGLRDVTPARRCAEPHGPPHHSRRSETGGSDCVGVAVDSGTVALGQGSRRSTSNPTQRQPDLSSRTPTASTAGILTLHPSLEVEDAEASPEDCVKTPAATRPPVGARRTSAGTVLVPESAEKRDEAASSPSGPHHRSSPDPTSLSSPPDPSEPLAPRRGAPTRRADTRPQTQMPQLALEIIHPARARGNAMMPPSSLDSN